MIELSTEYQYIKTNNSVKTGCVVTLKTYLFELTKNNKD